MSIIINEYLSKSLISNAVDVDALKNQDINDVQIKKGVNLSNNKLNKHKKHHSIH